jgi:spore coat polysaccharide biosynthesis predicted glycosyltransferase SpsG
MSVLQRLHAARFHPVLFRVAGGHRLGFGHIVRAMSLARALGVPARISVRGTENARRVARQLGAHLEERSLDETLSAGEHALLVIDDPNAHTAAAALTVARKHGVAVASVHDLGIAPIASDLAVDGSIVSLRRHWPAAQALLGSRYAVLDADIAGLRAYRTARVDTVSAHPTEAMPFIDEQPRVVVSLGGGRRAGVSWRIGRELAVAFPDVQVIVATGFGSDPRGGRGKGKKDASTCMLPNLRALSAPEWLRLELARATVAIVAGGVTLYEAAALGVPTVAVAVTPAQRPTIAGFVRVRAASAAGDASADLTGVITRVMRCVVRLLDDARARERMTLAACAAVDGQGSQRVAGALRTLMSKPEPRDADDRAAEELPHEPGPSGSVQMTV